MARPPARRPPAAARPLASFVAANRFRLGRGLPLFVRWGETLSVPCRARSSFDFQLKCLQESACSSFVRLVSCHSIKPP